MQDKRIDQLPLVRTINDNDLFAISRDEITNSISFSDLFAPVYRYIKRLILTGELGTRRREVSNEPAIETEHQSMYNVQIEEVNKLKYVDSDDLLMICQNGQSRKILTDELYKFLDRAADEEYMGMYLHRPTWEEFGNKTWAEMYDRLWDSDSEGL